MNKTDLLIVKVPITELKTNEYNPRKHNEKQSEDLKNSIKKFWFVDPVVVNSNTKRKNIVIWWAFRLEIAKELKYTEIPVVSIDLDIKKEKELNLRLNKNIWEWDLDILKDFEVELLLDVWFDNQELSAIWDSVLEIENDNFNTEKELEKIKTPKSKTGDIYQLWKHKLVCWDSTDHKVIKSLMWEKKTSMIYCDWPYNIWLNYSSWIWWKADYWGWYNSDSKTRIEYKSFMWSTIKNILKFSNTDTHVFYWADENYIWLFQELFIENWIENRRVCLWIKNNQNVTPQIAFNKVYEPCVYWTIWKPYINKDLRNLNEILNKEVWTGNRCLDDIHDLFNIWLVKRKNTADYEHPTEKPPVLHEKALKRCSKPWDIVVDLFWWSGSTLIACEQLNRKCYTVEKDPVFTDLIIRRYEELTWKKAIKIN